MVAIDFFNERKDRALGSPHSPLSAGRSLGLSPVKQGRCDASAMLDYDEKEGELLDQQYCKPSLLLPRLALPSQMSSHLFPVSVPPLCLPCALPSLWFPLP
jgi:hypothetical protein